MVAFMNRSIDLLEGLAHESNNIFQMNRRGYVFLTADPTQVNLYQETSRKITALGAGQLRIHRGYPKDPPYAEVPVEGFQGAPDGADLVLDPQLIHRRFPFITNQAISMLHTRRCGWLSAQQLGTYLLKKARSCGIHLLRGKVVGVKTRNHKFTSVVVEGEGLPGEIASENFVIASGPYLREIGAMIGVNLPVYNELHGKVAINDPLKLIPRDAPLMVWSDPVCLSWSEREIKELTSDPKTRWLTEQLPAGVHFRPEGGKDSPVLLMLWTYNLQPKEPTFPLDFDPFYPELVLRGLVTMLPDMAVYLERIPKPYVDGGYYCKTQENRPLIGPTPVQGVYVYGALSGFGIMGAMAGGELLAAHLTGGSLPHYAPAFLLNRYQDPKYQALLADWDVTSGQL